MKKERKKGRKERKRGKNIRRRAREEALQKGSVRKRGGWRGRKNEVKERKTGKRKMKGRTENKVRKKGRMEREEERGLYTTYRHPQCESCSPLPALCSSHHIPSL